MPAINYIWVTAQGICRKTTSTIIEVFDGHALELLRKYEVIGPKLESAIKESKAPFDETLQKYASVALADECIRVILQPVFLYLSRKGSWEALNFSPLMPVLKPAAQCYAQAIPSRYERFGSLTKRNLSRFIETYTLIDKGLFSHDCDETAHLSIRLCRAAAIVTQNGTLLDEYLDCVLTPLFSKAVQQTGTRFEVANLATTLQKFFDSMRFVPNTATAAPRPKREHLPEATPPEKPGAEGNTSEKSAGQVASLTDSIQSVSATLSDALAELDKLIGIPRVKDEVRKLAAFLAIQKERRKHGLPATNQTLHFVFTGNPGTGKTTVARIVAKVLFGFEFLKTPKLLETDRTNLVGGYLGQTAIKTDEVITSALDGVLFIDEAYALHTDDVNDPYGREAIGTLLKRMEDHRNRLSVIVAGYPALMDKFLKANPGFKSRFTRTIHFDDYSVSELGRIFLEYCDQAKYELDPRCLASLSIALALAYEARDENFGNARFTRNLFEEVQIRSSQRLFASSQGQIDKQQLVRLDPSDFMAGPLRGFEPKSVPLDSLKWRSFCPACKARYTGSIAHLGRTITCRRCKAVFPFECWEPLLAGEAFGTPLTAK